MATLSTNIAQVIMPFRVSRQLTLVDLVAGSRRRKKKCKNGMLSMESLSNGAPAPIVVKLQRDDGSSRKVRPGAYDISDSDIEDVGDRSKAVQRKIQLTLLRIRNSGSRWAFSGAGKALKRMLKGLMNGDSSVFNNGVDMLRKANQKLVKKL